VEQGVEFSFASYTLDLRRGVLQEAGRQVELRPKAFHLLSYLVRNAGRVISKDELLETIWPGVTVTEESLTQCIGEVRRKLDSGGAASSIKTVPRRGYLFEESALTAPASGVGPIASAKCVGLGKPSIAVMPFRNLSKVFEQDYFADGIVDDLTTALGHFRQIIVISRNSAFSFKGEDIDGQSVRLAFGVRYVLQGSVRKFNSGLRISAQLIDAQDRIQLWADQYDGELVDVFAFQDQVTRRVIGAIAPRILQADLARLKRWRPENLGSYELYLRGQENLRRMTRKSNEDALAMVEEALSLEPEYAEAAGLGAWACTMWAAQGWDSEVLEHKRKGLELAARAIADGQGDSDALSYGGYAIGFLDGQLAVGLQALERAISINPNNALALTNAGWLKTYMGEVAGAITYFNEAKLLSPGDPGLYRLNTGMAWALILNGDYAQAVQAAREARESNPNYFPALRAHVCALAHAGRLDDARKAISDLLRLDPCASITGQVAKFLRSESILKGLKLAGFQD
jgi:adenylate cyclase